MFVMSIRGRRVFRDQGWENVIDPSGFWMGGYV